MQGRLKWNTNVQSYPALFGKYFKSAYIFVVVYKCLPGIHIDIECKAITFLLRAIILNCLVKVFCERQKV